MWALAARQIVMTGAHLMDIVQAGSDLLARYLEACQDRDIERIAACFVKDAVVEDPLTSDIRGHDQIATYFRSLYDDLHSLEFTLSPLYWCRAAAACRWQGRAVRRDGALINYEGVDVFQFSDAPLITRLSAYWDPKDFASR